MRGENFTYRGWVYIGEMRYMFLRVEWDRLLLFFDTAFTLKKESLSHHLQLLISLSWLLVALQASISKFMVEKSLFFHVNVQHSQLTTLSKARTDSELSSFHQTPTSPPDVRSGILLLPPFDPLHQQCCYQTLPSHIMNFILTSMVTLMP